MSNENVVIKGIKDGLLVVLSPTEEWLGITSELAAKIDEKSSFFAGAKITVDVGERPVPKHELGSLKALLERRQLTLSLVQSSSRTTLEAATALDLRILGTHIADENAERDLGDELPIDPEEVGTQGVMIRRTLRSGRTVHSRGHVVIYGDVNPGAKIIATGDIIIWGHLRGMVHAGAEGNTEAMVCALDMSPNQLRIADYIATSPEGERRKNNPEMAFVRDDQIVVESWG